MSIKNDEKIMLLKSQIAEKKDKLKDKKKFVSVTNCSLDLDGARYNLNVSGKDQLVSLMVKLNMYRLSVSDLGLLEEYEISGYKINDWLTDIKSKLEIITLREEENKLKVLEAQLHKLLSDDKKTELEIESIESLLR